MDNVGLEYLEESGRRGYSVEREISNGSGAQTRSPLFRGEMAVIRTGIFMHKSPQGVAASIGLI